MVDFTLDSPLFVELLKYFTSIESGLKTISSTTDNLRFLQNISISLQEMVVVPPQKLGLFEWFDKDVYGMIMFFILCALLIAIILFIIACIIWLFLCYPRRQKKGKIDPPTEIKILTSPIEKKPLPLSSNDLSKDVQFFPEKSKEIQPHSADLINLKKDGGVVHRAPSPVYPETKKEKSTTMNQPFYCPRFPHVPLEIKANLPLPSPSVSSPIDVSKEIPTPTPEPTIEFKQSQPSIDIPIIDGTEPLLMKSDAEIKELSFQDCVDKRPSAPSSRKQSVRSTSIPPPYPMPAPNLLVPAISSTPSPMSSDVSSPKQSIISPSIASLSAKNKERKNKKTTDSFSDDEAFQQKMQGNETMPGRNVKGLRKEVIV